MESCTKGEMSSHSMLEASPKSRGEKATTIRIDFQRNTVKGYNSRDVQVHQLTSSYRLANWKEVSKFGKPIYDNEDGIVSFLGFWKASDEIHTDFVPFSLWNRQRLKCTSRSLMFCLNATTNITFGNKSSNVSLHPSPPKSLVYNSVPFCAIGMNREGCVMGFFEDEFP